MKRALFVILMVLLADQALKVWVKTHMPIGGHFSLCGEDCQWAQIHFVENSGMAFGWSFGGEYGKLILTVFRIIAVAVIWTILAKMIRTGRGAWITMSLALIFAGALGNIIDSAFYGLLFSASDEYHVARFLPAEGGYGSFLHGAVVDMFYFPLWSGILPDWIPFFGGRFFQFFNPIFNIADAAISVGVVLMVLVQRKPAPVEEAPGGGIERPLPEETGMTEEGPRDPSSQQATTPVDPPEQPRPMD